EGKTPWQLAIEKVPNLKKEALMLAPIDLDLVVKNFALGGNYVLTDPFLSFSLDIYSQSKCKSRSIFAPKRITSRRAAGMQAHIITPRQGV
ncbi:MAG: hypothetical protein V2A72_05095, partial [Candidatus Omnitrophota bacterium]